MPKTGDDELARQCHELGDTIRKALDGYPDNVVVCVLTGMTAAVCLAINVPHETAIALFNSALRDIRNAGLL